jgi:hypothetical protein
MDEIHGDAHSVEHDDGRAAADARERVSERDVDLGGRDRLAMGRAAAASGDAGAAEAFLAGALGSEDPAVAGEAAAALGEAAAARARRRRRLK